MCIDEPGQQRPAGTVDALCVRIGSVQNRSITGAHDLAVFEHQTAEMSQLAARQGVTLHVLDQGRIGVCRRRRNRAEQ